jgi:hypothetical protein
VFGIFRFHSDPVFRIGRVNYLVDEFAVIDANEMDNLVFEMQRKEILVLVIDCQWFFGRFASFEYPNAPIGGFVMAET